MIRKFRAIVQSNVQPEDHEVIGLVRGKLLYWDNGWEILCTLDSSDIIYEHGSLKEVKNVKQALDTIIENTGDLRETVDLHSEIIGDVEERLRTAINKVNQNTNDLRELNSKVEFIRIQVILVFL